MQLIHNNSYRRSVTFLIAFLLLLMFAHPALAVNPPDFTAIVAKTGDAVVNITTVSDDGKKMLPDDLRTQLEGTPLMDMLRQMYGDKLDEKLSGKGPSLGSGTVISSDGYIVTNYHVIENARDITVRLHDRREFKATVVGRDPSTDLALIKIDANNLPYLNYADSNDVKVGQWVLAIGSPFGFENSLSTGVISATGRSFGNERYVPFIQTDAAVNPGNSGGPLLNLQGEIIGINSQIISESGGFSGLSFAVPSNTIKAVVAQLKEHGSVSRGWLGLAFQDLDAQLAASFGLHSINGALVSRVMPTSPSAQAGIHEGDVITHFNNTEIKQATDLPPIVALLPVNAKVPVTVMRDGKPIAITLILSAYDASKNAINTITNTPAASAGLDDLHASITVRELQPFELATLDVGNDSTNHGIVVMRLDNKAWEDGGLKVGDVILKVNQHWINNTSQFYDSIKNLEKNQPISLLVTRPGEVQHYVAVKFSGDRIN